MKISRIMLLAISLAGLFLSFAGHVSALTTADTEETIYLKVETKIYTGEKSGIGGRAFNDGSASSPLYATFFDGVYSGPSIDGLTDLPISGSGKAEIGSVSVFASWALDLFSVDFRIRSENIHPQCEYCISYGNAPQFEIMVFAIDSGGNEIPLNIRFRGGSDYESRLSGYTSGNEQDFYTEIDPKDLNLFYNSDGSLIKNKYVGKGKFINDSAGSPYIVFQYKIRGSTEYGYPLPGAFKTSNFYRSGCSGATAIDRALNCSDTVKVVLPFSLPESSVTLAANPVSSTFPDNKTTLTWEANNIDNCKASSTYGNWRNSKGATGKEIISDLWQGRNGPTADEEHIFTLTCEKKIGDKTFQYKASAKVLAKAPPPIIPPLPPPPLSVSCSASPVLVTASDEEKTKQLNSFCDDCGDSDKLSTEWTARLGINFPTSDFLTAKRIGSDIYVTGSVNSASKADDYDLVLKKYGEDGSLKWEKIWDGGPREGGLVLATDGSFVYAGGLVREEITKWWFFKSWNNSALLQKYDFDGNLKWTKVWRDTTAEHHEINGLAVVGSGLYVSHWNSTKDFEKIKAVVKKLDLDELNKSASNDRLLRPEQIKWSQSYGADGKITTADGDIYADGTGVWITGAFNASRQSDSLYGGDAYLAKIGSNGNIEWLKTFNFKDEHGYDGYDNGFNLVSDGQHIYIAGVTASSEILNDWDAMIAKFDKNGELIWKKSPSGAGAEFARGIAVDDQYLYVAHGVSGKEENVLNTVLAKYDKNSGNLAKFNYWGESGTDQVTNSLALDKDNKFVYLANKTRNGATFDALLIKASEENSNGSRAIFEADASDGKPLYIYSWSGTDGLSGSDSMVTKSYSTIGTKYADVTVKDSSSPRQEKTKTCSVTVSSGSSSSSSVPASSSSSSSSLSSSSSSLSSSSSSSSLPSSSSSSKPRVIIHEI